MPIALAVTIGALLLSQPEAAKTNPAAKTAPLTAEHSLGELSNRELIERLPPARDEMVRQDGVWNDEPVSIEFRKRVTAGRVSAAELEKAVRHSGMLRSSPTCFDGRPYHVWLRMPSWLLGEKAVATPTLAGMRSAHADEYDLCIGGCGVGTRGQEYQESFQRIGVLPAGTTKVEFALTISPSDIWPGPKIHQSIQVVLPVELVPEAAPKPIADADVTALVKKSLGLSCINACDRGMSWAGIDVRCTRPATGPLTSTVLTVATELLKDERVVASRLRVDPDEERDDILDLDALRFIQGDAGREIVERKDIEHYSVRVHGVAPTTANPWCRTRYWSGEFTVPLSGILEPQLGVQTPADAGTTTKK